MSVRLYYHDIQGDKLSQLINWRAQNVTTAERTTLGGTLSGTHIGLFVFDTDEAKGYFWDGSAWSAMGTTVSGAMTFKGVVGYDAAEPGTPSTGDYYVFNTAGTNTWNTSDEVQIGDSVVWNGTTWDFIQGNVLQSSETVAGVVELATTSEASTGTDTARAVTAAGLTAFSNSKAFAKTFFASGVSLTAGSAYTVNHALGLQNRDACLVAVYDSSHNQISVDIDTTDANNLTVTSSTALTGVQIIVIGF